MEAIWELAVELGVEAISPGVGYLYVAVTVVSELNAHPVALPVTCESHPRWHVICAGFLYTEGPDILQAHETLET